MVWALIHCSRPVFSGSGSYTTTLHTSRRIFTQEIKMLGPECGIIDIRGDIDPSRLDMPQNALWSECDSAPWVGSCPPARPYQIRTADWSGPSSTWASSWWWVTVPIETSRARIHAKTSKFTDKVDKLLSAEIARNRDNSEIGNQRLPGLKMRSLWLLTFLTGAS